MSRRVGWENSHAQDQFVCRCRNFDRGRCRSMGGLDHHQSASSTGDGLNPIQLMMNAKELPAVEFVDYTFVFN